MLREDYLMRHIQKLADAVARILRLNECEEYEAALAAADQVWDELLDVPRALIHAVDTATLVGMLREPAKLRLAGRLFFEEARALAGRGDGARAAVRSRRALELLLEARAIDSAGSARSTSSASSASSAERAEDDQLIDELARTVPRDALAERYRKLLEARG